VITSASVIFVYTDQWQTIYFSLLLCVPLLNKKKIALTLQHSSSLMQLPIPKNRP